MKPYLSVIIPSYNEEVNLRLGVLDKVGQFLERQKYTWEAIIVDDGSTDESQHLVEEFIAHNSKFRLVSKPHRGKAATVISGMLQAEGDYVLFMDMDQAVPVSQINKLLPWFDQGYDVVIGSRNQHRRGAPLTRILMARGFMFVRGLILGMSDIVDTQCGFKAFSKKAVKQLFLKLQVHSSDGNVAGSRVTAGFDVEVLFLAKKLGFKIKEVSVSWYHVDTRRVNPIRDSLEALRDLMKVRINDSKGTYK